MTIEFEYGRPSIKRGGEGGGIIEFGDFINPQEELPIKVEPGQTREFVLPPATKKQGPINIKVACDKNDRGGVARVRGKWSKFPFEDIVLGQAQEAFRAYDANDNPNVARGFKAKHVRG